MLWIVSPRVESVNQEARPTAPGVSSSSSLHIELGSPIRIGQWSALPLQARSSDQQLAEQGRLWALEVMGDAVLANTEFVVSSPEELLALQLASDPADCAQAF